MQSQHGKSIRSTTAVALEGDRPAECRVSFPKSEKSIECPVDGCRGRATNLANLRVHFAHRHPCDTVVILEEGSLPCPKCDRCDMQVPWHALNGRHRHAAMCERGADRKKRRLAAEAARQASETVFSACGQPLENASSFTHLGRWLTENDSDWQAVTGNLKKARKKWGRISRILAREGADAKTSGVFCVVVVLQILLCGSESWVLTPRILKALESFHHRAARRITGNMPRRLQNGTWCCPRIGKALEDAGLFSVAERVARRQKTVAECVATRPIFDLFMKEERQRGTPATVRWWEQFAINFKEILDEMEAREEQAATRAKFRDSA